MRYTYYRLYITKFFRYESSSQPFANLGELRLINIYGHDVTQMEGVSYSASTSHDPVARAFDNNTGSYWESNWSGAIPAWIKVQFPTPQQIGEYRVCPRNNSYSGRPDRPIDFELQASNDDENWVTIDSQTGLNDGWAQNTYRVFSTSLAVTIKYLISSQGDYYTISNDQLTNVSSTLNAQLFSDYGLDAIPDWDDYSSLNNPSVLCWCDEEELPMTAVTTGVPTNPQVVISQNILMTHSTITGIDSVTIDSDEDTLFAMSFDNGSTWWNYVNDDWVQLTTQTSGQDKDSVEDIPTNAWNAKATSNQIKFRFVLLDETGYVTKIQVNYTN